MTPLYIKIQTLYFAYQYEAARNPYFLPVLKRLLELYQGSVTEDKLKLDLRFFLNYPHNTSLSFEPLKIRVAAEIAEQNEPIITLLIPALKNNYVYADESFSEIELQELTETVEGNKRRLKNLKNFILSDDSTRLISGVLTCNAALRTNKGDVLYDQSFPQPTILSATEQARLENWNPQLVRDCISYLKTKEPLWVRAHFVYLRKNQRKNALLYEIELLKECLWNASNNPSADPEYPHGYQHLEVEHDIPALTIANTGIRRFYKVWCSLSNKQRQLIEQDGHLKSILFRIMWGADWTQNELKALPRQIKQILNTNYINLTCVGEQAAHLGVAIKDIKNQLNKIIIKSPTQPIILDEMFKVQKNDTKNQLFAQLERADYIPPATITLDGLSSQLLLLQQINFQYNYLNALTNFIQLQQQLNNTNSTLQLLRMTRSTLPPPSSVDTHVNTPRFNPGTI